MPDSGFSKFYPSFVLKYAFLSKNLVFLIFYHLLCNYKPITAQHLKKVEWSILIEVPKHTKPIIITYI